MYDIEYKVQHQMFGTTLSAWYDILFGATLSAQPLSVRSTIANMANKITQEWPPPSVFSTASISRSLVY